MTRGCKKGLFDWMVFKSMLVIAMLVCQYLDLNSLIFLKVTLVLVIVCIWNIYRRSYSQLMKFRGKAFSVI